jgi:tRNA modification GTPase
VTILTPSGRGAIAVVAVEGRIATIAVEKLFLSATGRRLCDVPIGRILFGRWAESKGEEVVVCRRSDNMVEVHCHGGVAASAAIADSLQELGCAARDPLRRLSAMEPDPIKRAATEALMDAVTERAAFVLLDQYRGALNAAMQHIEDLISQHDFQSAREEIGILLQRASLGLHLTKPWRIVLAGRPNVGKSSLINALVGYERAIVFETPGTTRDVVTAVTAFRGWAVEFSDTAGQRETSDTIEAAGVVKARELCATADLVILVFDSIDPTSYDEKLLAENPGAMIVWNKSDLLADGQPPAPGLRVSAVSGQGLDVLADNIMERITEAEFPRGAAVPFTTAQILYLQSLLAEISR